MFGSSIGLLRLISGSLGKRSVDSPVIAVNEVFGARPYAWRSSL